MLDGGGADNLLRGGRRLLKNYGFTRGVLVTASIVSVIVFCSYLADLSAGVSAAVGIFLVSICDLPGNRQHHFKNMGYGLLLSVVNLVLIQLAQVHLAVNLLVMPLLVFATAYLSVFGKRAGLVSFSGILAIVLAYAFPKSGWDIIHGALFVVLGGSWFILLNFLVVPFRYRRYRLELLNECIELTADYLQLKRLQLREADPNRHWPELIRTHNRINELREVLTDYFLNQAPKHDTLGEQAREGVLYLELVDLIELAAAVPVRPEGKSPAAQVITTELANVLGEVAEALRRVARKSRNFVSSVPETLRERLRPVSELLRSAASDLEEHERYYVYILYENVKRQLGKIRGIEGMADTEEEPRHAVFSRKNKSALRSSLTFDVATLRAQFTPASPVFRHCIRLAIVMLIGYLFGLYFSLQNAYWIILTVAVIMRPTYVQSKERSVQRTLGTLLGGAVAAAIVSLTDSPVAFALIGATTMPFVFTYLDRNYRRSAFFITLNLIFTYALLNPDTYSIISFRVLDTLIGAGLSLAASLLLWPLWDSSVIRDQVARSIGATSAYLGAEANLYSDEDGVSLEYRVARMNAFLCLGELDASFGRVLREPKHRHRRTDVLYALISYNHEILGAVAHLGTYLQSHALHVSPQHLGTLIDELMLRLLECRDLARDSAASPEAAPSNSEAIAYFANSVTEGPPVAGSLHQKRLILNEYHYLHGLISNLRDALRAYTNEKILARTPRQ